jgi:pantoate kinase
MAQTPEGKVKDKIKKILKTHNIYFAMPMGTGYGNAGVPDFLCCFGGRFLAIEAKANGGQTTALQRKNLAEIEECGGTALVIDENNLGKLEAKIKLFKGELPVSNLPWEGEI